MIHQICLPKICGFCLIEIRVDPSGKMPAGVSGINGFICIQCIKKAKKILDDHRDGSKAS